MTPKITKSYSNNSTSISAEVMTSLVSKIPVALFAAIDKTGTCLETAKQRKSHLLYKRISETEDFFFCQKNRLRCIRQQVLQLGQSSPRICRRWFLIPIISSTIYVLQNARKVTNPRAKIPKLSHILLLYFHESTIRIALAQIVFRSYHYFKIQVSSAGTLATAASSV